jgi:serine/threonine-protein kinase
MSASDVEAQLARMLASEKFSRGRLGAFLQYVVEETLAGRKDQLKESVIGVQVFQREADYDPRLDPIVRVEARRLRQRLEQYYGDEGASDPVVIELPKGGYSPEFRSKQRQPPRQAGFWTPLRIALTAVVAGALAVSGFLSLHRRQPGRESPATLFVAPFTNLSQEKDSEYLSEGLTEELIDVLAHVQGLQVITRGQAFQMRNVEAREAARSLHAAWIVEGSLRQSGGQLRIAARLLEAGSGKAVWAHTYERQAAEVFRMQEEIAQAIANALRLELKVDRGRPLSARYSENVEAFNYYLKGRYHWGRLNMVDAHLAIRDLEQAIAVDSNYAPAYSQLAMIYALLGFYQEMPPREAWEKAEATARRALAIDPGLAEAHAALGMAEVYSGWRWKEADAEFRRALELNPASAIVRGTYVLLWLVPQARLSEAKEQAERALVLDPLEPVASYILPYITLAQGDPAAAVGQYRKFLELLPQFPNGWWDMGMAYAVAGDKERARAAFEKAGEIREGSRYRCGAIEYALLGEADRARERVRGYEKRPPRSMEMARIYAVLGDADDAFRWLERAFAERDGELLYLKTDPRLRKLHGDRRYAELVRRMGL